MVPEAFAATADAYIAKTQQDGPEVATRKASQMALDAYGRRCPS